ncbi:MAG: capsular polysaccharide biosynthesis protein [Propylenella sp.]
MTPVRWDTFPRPHFDAVAGWGHSPTSVRARRLARRRGVPYIAFEDGPLRSVRPGPAQPPMSMVLDRGGIYYRADTPSDLIALAAEPDWFDTAVAERAAEAAGTLRRLRLSKYNAGRERTPEEMRLTGGSPRVLVLDQVRDDASISGALAGASAFDEMLAAAIAENPSAEIIVKQHPDVLTGRRAGYFGSVTPGERLKVVAEAVNPWSLLDAVDAVYTVSSGLGFEAALAGKRVVLFGSPFYAGWGFTDDRRLAVTRPCAATALELFAAYYLRYARYFDAYSRQEISFEEAAEQLGWMRDRFLEQDSPAICYCISRWKRGPIDRMLDGPAGRPTYTNDMPTALDLATRRGGRIVAWASRDNARLEAASTEAGVPLEEVEDGFIRSAGLGATFVLPLSLVFDRRGIFYDSRRPSDLEIMLEEAEFPPELLLRASRLRERLLAAGTTKYNVAPNGGIRIDSGGRPIILVPGQVEDDASIQRGSPRLKRNIELLEAVRGRHPDAFVLYKPHPDVEAGIRRGRVPEREAARFADRIVISSSILRLIGVADRVETMTSLAGFEALIRGKPVTTHGQPFYAGWGLSEDLCPVARRTRNRSLDELVAAALILYPRYLDPVSGLVCGPELLIERLAAEGRRQPAPVERLVRLAQISAARALHMGHAVRMLARRGT